MSTLNVSNPLEPGVWGVIPTPFQPNTERIDTESLARLVSFYESVGATGLTMLGVFGEATSLTRSERAEVLRTAAGACSLPIVVGVTSRSTMPAIEEVKAAESALRDRLRAVMIQVNSPEPEVVITHLRCVYAATESPVVLQDYPASSGIRVSTTSLAAIANACPFVCAIKAESAPTAVAVAKLNAQTDVSVFGGLGGQGLLDELAAGSAGAMTGFSWPEALVACVRESLTGRPDAAFSALIPYCALVNAEQQPGIALAIRKEIFRRRGLIASGAVRAPAKSFPPELSAIVERHVRWAEDASERD